MPSQIDPSAIPGENLKPDDIDIAANQMRFIGTDVADQGFTVLSSWQGITAHYEAPESSTLFSVMDPVGTAAETFGTNVGTLATALNTFADEIRPIKAELDAIRAEATSFVASTRNGVEKEVIAPGSYTTSYQAAATTTQTVEWHEDQDTVDKNNELIERVNAQMVLLWAAERSCANKIYDIIGQPHIEAASDSNPNGYGVNEIPEGSEMPWGAAVERTESCGEQAVGAVGRFVWDGVIVGGIWGTVTSLGTLVLGYNPSTGEWFQGDMYGAAWSNLGMLGVGLATAGPLGIAGSQLPGPVGDFFRGGQDALVNAGKGIIAWDKWEEDPAEAAGTAVFNVATIIIPAGAAVGAVKTGTSATAAAIRTTATVVDFVDPAALLVRGGSAGVRASLPLLSDIARTFDFSTIGDLGSLGSRGDIPRFEVPTVPGGGFDFDPPISAADDAPVYNSTDAPAPRGQETVQAPVREPALVGAATPSGSTVVDAPPATSSGSGGSSAGGTGAPGTGGAGSAAPGSATPGSGTPGSTTPDDAAPGSGGPNSDNPATGGSDSGSSGSDAPAAPDRPWNPEDGDPVLSDASRGEGWERDLGERGNPVDPAYGQPRADHGVLGDAYAPPQVIPEQIRDLVTDPTAPYGRDANGTPYSRAEWQERYIGPDNRPIYPGNAGAVPGSRIDFTDVAEFQAHYGDQLDRMGGRTGDFLSFPGTPFEHRALPGSNLNDPYFTFELTGRLPEGVRIEVSEVAPAFGQPGGGLQVRFLDADGPLSVQRLFADDILEGVLPDSLATPHFTEAVHGADAAAPAPGSSYPAPTVAQTIAVDAPGPRTPFSARLDLEPDTAYIVDGRGTFTTGADGRVVHVETTYGGTGNLNADLNNPAPNVTYVVNGNQVFITDDLGRTAEMHVEGLRLEDADRSRSVQSRVGHMGGEGYEGGHLNANSTGGGGEIVNTVPMLEGLNRGSGNSYFNLENRLRGLISEVPPAQVDLHVYSIFGDNSRVPTKFEVEYSINGQTFTEEFRNV